MNKTFTSLITVIAFGAGIGLGLVFPGKSSTNPQNHPTGAKIVYVSSIAGVDQEGGFHQEVGLFKSYEECMTAHTEVAKKLKESEQAPMYILTECQQADIVTKKVGKDAGF